MTDPRLARAVTARQSLRSNLRRIEDMDARFYVQLALMDLGSAIDLMLSSASAHDALQLAADHLAIAKRILGFDVSVSA